MKSLRFRLPALFLAGIALSGLVTSLIALRLFQDYTGTETRRELRHGDLTINAGRREVKIGETEIQLAPKEFDLLWELLDHKGLVLTRDQLLERVWGYTFAGDTRTVDVHVRQLRRKLGEASPIVTVWGVGYKVGPDRSPAPAA